MTRYVATVARIGLAPGGRRDILLFLDLVGVDGNLEAYGLRRWDDLDEGERARHATRQWEAIQPYHRHVYARLGLPEEIWP